jgi:hypothetical protein
MTFPVDFDRFVFYEILHFLDPLECAKVEAVRKLWRDWIQEGSFWQIVRCGPLINHLTFRKAIGLSDKAISLWAWLFVSGRTRAYISLVGGSRDEPACYNATLNFVDTAESYSVSEETYTDEESYFPAEISASAVTLDCKGAILSFGGWCGEEATNVCMRRDTRHAPWKLFHQLPIPRCCYAAATCTVEGDVIVSGGGSSIFNGAEVFQHSFVLRADNSNRDDDWGRLPDMCQPRCGHGSVTLPSGRCYVVGGYGGGSLYHTSSEFFCAHQMAWIPSAPMLHSRSGAGVTVSPQGCIYAVGGSPDGLSAHDSVEMFDERVGRWEVLPHRMTCCRGYNGACFGPSGILYAAGGLDNDECMASIEWMDPRTNTWQLLTQEQQLGPFDVTPVDDWDRRYLFRADFQMVWQPR